MRARILALFHARLRAQLGGEVVPAAALLAQGSLVAVAALLVRDVLDPFSYALFVLTASAGLVALTLLGEFGSLLQEDPAAEWAEALPARPIERRLAQGLVALVLLGLLALGTLLPAALFAPSGMPFEARVALLVAGLEQAFTLGALLLAAELLLGERIEGALVLLQTALVVLVIAGFLAGLRLVPALRELDAARAEWPGWIAAFPPAWFARAVAAPAAAAPLASWWLAHLAAPVVLFVMLAAPRPKAPAGRKSTTLTARLLAPARALAERLWVARDERGPFRLVFDALPLERDFVLRTYPMIGIPLAFLLAGARGGAGPERQGLLALLLFTPAVYLPVLLAQVPVTRSPLARWILDGAPVRAAAIRNGTIKAIALRFLFPLYVALAALAAALGEARLALHLALPGALASLLVLRRIYPRIVLAPPLSTAPDEIEAHHDWMGLLLTLAAVLVVLAIAAQHFVDTLPRALALSALLLAAEALLDRAERRRASG